MRLRRCFASDPAPSSPAARRWRAASRCGGHVTHPVSDGPQAARSGRLFGHVGTSRPTSRSPGRRPYESRTRRFIKARNLISCVPGHRNVIRAVAPCVYRPSARLGLRLACASAFLDRRIPGAGRCDGRQSPASPATRSVSGVAPCVTTQLPKGRGVSRSGGPAEFVTNCSEYD